MNRRFVAALLALLLLLAGCKSREKTPQQPAPPPQEATAAYDLVIRGGTLVDGSGTTGYTGDLAIVGDRIVAVGTLPRHTTKREINATGLTVAPGFINPHSHTHDIINTWDDFDTTASLMQGITTEIGGVDGRSPVPVGAFLNMVEKEGTGVNFGLFIGQGSVREKVMGFQRGQAGSTQLEQMRQLVRQGMEEGAFGLSSGLEYHPGSFADQAEITALAAVTKPYGGVYSTHIRSEGDAIVEAVQEALAVGKNAGVTVNLSHFKIVKSRNWGKEEQVVALVEGALSQGQNVFADVYPYLAPDYGVNVTIASAAEKGAPPEYMLISMASDRTLLGKTVAQAAADLKLPLEQAIPKLEADKQLRVVGMVSSEKAMLRFYRSKWAVISTDGESRQKLPTAQAALAESMHRRSYGTYGQVLGELVRERKILPLPDMIRKMSGQVADSLGVKDRGYLKPGYHADVVVFDAGKVADRTTWLSPQEYADGFRHVLVNGQIAVEDGKRVPGRPGRIVRPGK